MNPSSSSALVAAQPSGALDLSPRTFEQALEFSTYLADSALVPKDFQGKPGNCLVAMQWGAELGLKPLQAVQSIAVINGRPAMWGDALLALVRGSSLCEWVIEEDDGQTAKCRVKRRGEPEQCRTFSIEDARTAGLAGKSGPWTQFPKRMRQLRARAFALRDVFPDVLRGMSVAEEAQDIPPAEKHMGMADEMTRAAPPAQPQVQKTLPAYPDDAFAQNLPKWREFIETGRKTAEQIIAQVQSKGSLTASQQEQIKDCAKLPEPQHADAGLGVDEQQPVEQE